MPARNGSGLCVALLAPCMLAGCGSTLFDAKGVPVVTPTCTDQSRPIACLGAPACLAEDDGHCGSACADCLASPIANATSFCDRSNPDLTQHACNYACAAGFEREPNGPGCRPALCAAPQIQCGGSCFTETTARCGPGCLDCSQVPTSVPPNGLLACLGAPGLGVCSFACPDGFLKSAGACVQIAPGSGSVALGASHACVITTAGNVMCWGANGSGQLGVGDTADRLAPTDVPLSGGATARFVAAGAAHTCVVTTTASLQCWGSNASAQLGLPRTTTTSLVPVDVPQLTGVNTVAAGTGHTCALLAGSGSVSCWGANDKGQAGQNPATPVVTAPASVNIGGAAAAQIATQADHTCAIRAANGQVSCWGANSLGQAGQSVNPNAPAVPGAWISGLTATAISVGGGHTCAIGFINNSNPGVYCWGDRSAGQLGSGTAGFSSTPVLAANIAPTLGSADLVLTGRAHTCDARSADGTVVCAGEDLSMQVGQSPPATSVARGPSIALPAPVDGLLGAGDRSCALAAGVLRCWGANAQGQLGNGATADSATPVSPRPF